MAMSDKWGARLGSGATTVIAFALLRFLDAQPVFAQRSGDVTSSEPLRLRVALSRTEARIDERLTVDLKLTNTSARAVGGCVRAWEDWMIVGTAGTHSGRKWVDDDFPPEHLFLLPPGHTLSWQLTIDLARFSAGKAQLMAFFWSDCFPGTSLERGVLTCRGQLSAAASFTVVE